MQDEGEEAFVVIKARRMTRYDIPIHFLNLITGITGCVNTFFGDVTFGMAQQAMQHMVDQEFKGMMKDVNSSGIGPRGPESQD
jgi:hypothetical protein